MSENYGATRTDDVEDERSVAEEPAAERPVYYAPTTEPQIVGAAAVDQGIDLRAFDRPAYERPDTEEPVFDMPAAEAPVAEAPAMGEPVADEPAFDVPDSEEPAAEAQTLESPTLETPAVDAPIAKAPEPPTGREPLLTEEAIAALLKRWDDIQVSFVDGPRNSVQGADTLIQDIGATFEAALRQRRNQLAEGWQATSDTEQLRCALTQYRSLVGVLLPK